MIFWILFVTFFKIGAFTFGGGYAMLPLIQSQVEGHQWMSTSQLIDFIAVSESTPGPFAVNVSTYVGMKVGGLLGAFCATLGVVLPSFIIIMIVAKCFDRFKNSKIVKGCMTGLKPAVVGLIGAAVVSVGKTALFMNGLDFVSMALFFAMTFLAFKNVHPIFIIAVSAFVGIGIGMI